MMPKVWALTGSRVGDNAQVTQFAEALGFEVRDVPLTYRALRHVPNWLLGATEATLTSGARARLQPPWPDVVVGAGQRSVPAALWIKKQSGGRTNLVFLGRPRAPLAWFDAVITTPQYGLPPASNVMVVPLPFTSKHQPPADLATWRDKWQNWQQPVTACLIGGDTWPYRLDEDSLQHLVELAQREAGEIVYATSPRTTVRQINALERLSGGGTILRWTAGAPNPFPALLQVADRFIVTEDSVSMIADACATGKPVSVARVSRGMAPAWEAHSGFPAWLARQGILSPPRNVRQLVMMLAKRGVVEMAGVARDEGVAGALLEWPEVIERVRALVPSPLRGEG